MCTAGLLGDDQLVEHFSGHCEIFTRLDDKFQFQGKADFAGGPSKYEHAVLVASPELARRFYKKWMG